MLNLDSTACPSKTDVTNSVLYLLEPSRDCCTNDLTFHFKMESNQNMTCAKQSSKKKEVDNNQMLSPNSL